MTEKSEVKARWAGYFEWLCQADPPTVELDVRGVTIPIAHLQSTVVHLRLWKHRAVVNRLKWGKAPGICGIHAELLKAWGNAVLVSLLQFCALLGTQASSQLTGRGALLSLSGKRRVIAKTATTTEG